MAFVPWFSLAIVASLSLSSGVSANGDTIFDLVVYGATPAGVGAALSMARLRPSSKILLLEPTPYVGGMASPGGIGLRDHHDASVLNSTELEWGMRNARKYNVTYPVWQPDAHVGQATFLDMIGEQPQIHLEVNQSIVEGPTSVDKSGTVVIAMYTQHQGSGDPIRWQGKYFVDGSYEGDLIYASGASMTFGRESRDEYNESYGGVTDSSIAQFDVFVDPIWPNGTLLPFLQNNSDPRQHVGEADANLMAYSFRACLSTDSENQVPFPKPDGYRTEDFEIARRYLAAELAASKSIRLPWGNLAYSSYPPGNKRDACCGSGPVGIDAVGLELGYANGTRSQRQAIYNLIKYYVQGLMYFWQQDPDAGVPAATRRQFQALGLCKDEWPENGHFPPQLYVREARRLVGDRVFTQNDRLEAKQFCREDSVGLAVWGIDIHEMQRTAVKDETNSSRLQAFNEGLTSPSLGGDFFYEIPYWVLLPKASEVTNVMSPNCPSISHVAFASLRVEPTLWRLGEVAGTAATLALGNSVNTSFHNVNMKQLHQLLLQQGIAIHYPFRPQCDTPIPPPPPPLPPNCTTLTVVGAGQANGNYQYSGQSAGYPKFQGPDGVSIYFYQGQWHIAISGKSILYFGASFTLHSAPP